MGNAGWKRYTVLSVMLLISLTAAGCGVKDVETPPVPLVSISVTPVNPSIAPGTTIQFIAIGIYANDARQNLTALATWSSSDPGVATIGANGLATSQSVGSTTITATYGGFTGSTTLTVAVPQSIAVTPAGPSIAVGTTQQFMATGIFPGGGTQNLTAWADWSSSNDAIATISNAPGSKGLAKASSNTTGSVTVTASFESVSGTASLTVATVASLSITPVDPSIVLGTTQQFTATGTLSNNVAQDLTRQAVWTSSNLSVATIGTTGLATSRSVGLTTIKATFGNVTESTTLSITAPLLKSIAITPSAESIPLGLTRQFTAIGTFSDSSTQDLTTQVTWRSSNTAVATIGAAGLATSRAAGSTIITATFSGITSNSAQLTVTAPVLISISVTPASASIPFGSTQQFTAMGTYSDNSVQDLTTSATWNSSNSSVATISNTGLAFTTGIGTTNITAAFSGITSNTAVLTVRVF